MTINKIDVVSFRNYIKEQAIFSNGVNIIAGANAQGKTNLLEAVFLLTGGKSFRTRSDGEMIIFGSDYSSINALFRAGGREQKIEIILRRGQRKEIYLNGVKIKAGGLSGILTAVIFCPEDLNIIKSGASSRRRLMDSIISQLRPGYTSILSEFTRLYEHKTRILRDWREKPSLLNTLDEFSESLLKKSSQIIRYRASFVKRLEEEARPIHAEFSGGLEILGLNYKTIDAVLDPTASLNEIYCCLKRHLEDNREAEINSRQCLTGAHKDDIEIFINKKEARIFASQGQARTAAISIKLAERNIHKEETGEYPVLLLDDVLSELDPARQDFVKDRIDGGQTLLTSCDNMEMMEKTGGRIIHVHNGRIFQN